MDLQWTSNVPPMEPKKTSKKVPNGPLKDLQRTTKGPPAGSQMNPQQTPNGPPIDPKLTPSDPPLTPNGPTNRPQTDPKLTTNRLPTDPNGPPTDPPTFPQYYEFVRIAWMVRGWLFEIDTSGNTFTLLYFCLHFEFWISVDQQRRNGAQRSAAASDSASRVVSNAVSLQQPRLWQHFRLLVLTRSRYSV